MFGPQNNFTIASENKPLGIDTVPRKLTGISHKTLSESKHTYEYFIFSHRNYIWCL